MIYLSIKFEDVKILLTYRSRALKSRGSYGNSALFLQRPQYIKLRFLCTKEDSKLQVRLLSARLRYAFVTGIPVGVKFSGSRKSCIDFQNFQNDIQILFFYKVGGENEK